MQPVATASTLPSSAGHGAWGTMWPRSSQLWFQKEVKEMSCSLRFWERRGTAVRITVSSLSLSKTTLVTFAAGVRVVPGPVSSSQSSVRKDYWCPCFTVEETKAAGEMIWSSPTGRWEQIQDPNPGAPGPTPFRLPVILTHSLAR